MLEWPNVIKYLFVYLMKSGKKILSLSTTSIFNFLLFVSVVRTLITLELIKYKFLVSKMRKLILRPVNLGQSHVACFWKK